MQTPENIRRVEEAVTTSLTRSANKHTRVLTLSNRTVRRILHDDLKFHRYKIQIVPQLFPRDPHNRLAFCGEFVRLVNARPDLLDNIIMSDEAHFHLSGFVNKQNLRYWYAEQPIQLHKKPLHAKKISV